MAKTSCLIGILDTCLSSRYFSCFQFYGLCIGFWDILIKKQQYNSHLFEIEHVYVLSTMEYTLVESQAVAQKYQVSTKKPDWNHISHI